MSCNIHDPKWTAYILGELDDAERAAIEAELHGDAAAQAFVAELRATIGQLESELTAEPTPVLTETQRERVLHRSPEVVPAPEAELQTAASGRGRPLVRPWLAALAATIFVAAGLTILMLPDVRGGREGVGRQQTINSLRNTGQATLRYTNTDPSIDLDAYAQETQTGKFQIGSAVNPDAGLKIDLKYDHTLSEQIAQSKGNANGSRSMEAVDRSAIPFDDEKRSATQELPKMNWRFRTAAEATKSPPTSPALPVSTGNAPQVANTAPSPYYISDDIQYYAPGPDFKLLTQARLKGLGQSLLEDTYGLDQTRLPQGSLALDGHGPAGATAGEQFGDVRTKKVEPQAPAPGQNSTAEATRRYLELMRADPNTLPRLETEKQQHNTAAYDHVVDNRFLSVTENPLSTFSTDVDTASYSILRRFLLQQNQLPPAGAVRIEELLNYFTYDYPQPTGDVPFAVTTEMADCPWAADHRLVRIGLKGREIDRRERPTSNLVFLIDVSGSMDQPNKLPLVQQGLRLLVNELRSTDHVAIVVYAGQAGLVLPSTSGDQKDRILAAIDMLAAGGSTNGAQGIEQAYEVASQNFVRGGTNRVLLATDGDFNVGVTSQDALIRLIEEKAKTGVFLTTLGFGYDNLKDSTLEKLADKGNGQYAYVDDLREARKVFVDQLSGTLVTIAKDVKVQIEFNPAEVASYRLIGYENRILAKEDFNDDKKDAGDIGAGHMVTALYEITPVAKQITAADHAASQPGAVDPLKYQQKFSPTDAARSGELLTLKLRYKQPDGETSRLIEVPVRDEGKRYSQASVDFRFAAGVAAFGMVLRNSPYKGSATLDAVLELVREGRGSDRDGYRAELIQLVERAKSLGAR